MTTTVRYDLHDSFWSVRRQRLVDITLPTQHAILTERGRLENFRRAAARNGEPSQGIYSFDDTDVYKWLEAASACGSATILATVDDVVAQVAAAQEPDGYLNTFYTGERAGQRWSNTESHELYTAGHLIQAAIAHRRATGSTALMDVARRFADLLVSRGTAFVDSHPQIELALAELAAETREASYLALAQAHLDARGHGRFGRPFRYFDPDYAQDHLPYRQLEQTVGHAVRMIYLASGAAEICAATGEAALRTALERQWRNLTAAKLYVTGGIGARHDGEAFGDDYELPSARAYAETCAAVACVYWNEKLLALTGEARFADLLERTLYNAALAGISLDGAHYFYDNPLASDGTHCRKPWFDCACCPPNVARLLAQMPRLVAQTVDDDTLRLTLWAAGSGEAEVAGGALRWRVATAMPWDGDVRLTIDAAPDRPMALELRVPAWTESPELTIDGVPQPSPTPGAFVRVERVWRPGATVALTLPMPVRRLVAHPRVVDAAGRVALQRGPLVYCIEGVDHPGVDLQALRLPATCALAPVLRPELLGGIVALEGQAQRIKMTAWDGALYTHAPPETPTVTTPFRAIPYYAWANREPSPMLVWIPT